MSARDPRVPWPEVFGNDRRVEVEIGPGRGETLLAFAAGTPATNFFGIEYKEGAAARIRAKAAARRLANLRVIAGDARCIVGRLVPDASVGAYHVYFPDPWPKNGHRHRRLMDATLARDLARTLAAGGAVHVASDLPALLDELRTRLAAAGLVHRPDAAAPSRPSTSFERRYAVAAGTFYAQLVRPQR